MSTTLLPPIICRQHAFSRVLDINISDSILDEVKQEFIFMIRKDTINNLVKSADMLFVYEKN